MSNDFRNTKYTLGIRNNNPGNIRPDGDDNPNNDFKGKVGENKGFIVFESVQFGLRALCIDLTNKYKRGLNTVEKIISVYAPPSENNTPAYINSVCLALGVVKSDKLKLSRTLIEKMVKAIIMHENGERNINKTITDEMITQGYDLIPDSLKSTVL